MTDWALCNNLLQVFQKIPSLLYLYLEKNQLKEIPSGLPASLEQLRLSKNSISKIPAGVFNKMTNLTMLDLYNNRVKPFLDVTHLACSSSKDLKLVTMN